MFHSVRARLTFWYTAILALVLITFSAISYALLAQATHSATDTSLADTAHEFAAAFSNDPDDDGRTGRGSVRVLAYQPKGRWLATANDDGVVRLVDADSGRLVRVLVGHAATIRTLAWTTDGQLLASAAEDKLIVWEGNARSTIDEDALTELDAVIAGAGEA